MPVMLDRAGLTAAADCTTTGPRMAEPATLPILCAWCGVIIRTDSPCGGHGICPACVERECAALGDAPPLSAWEAAPAEEPAETVPECAPAETVPGRAAAA